MSSMQICSGRGSNGKNFFPVYVLKSLIGDRNSTRRMVPGVDTCFSPGIVSLTAHGRQDHRSEGEPSLADLSSRRDRPVDPGSRRTARLADASLEGAIAVAQEAQQVRAKLAVSRHRLTVLPLASRFDGRAELAVAAFWLELFSKALEPFYEDWLPTQLAPRQILELTKITICNKVQFRRTIAGPHPECYRP
jgi:hypothetical protein